MLGKGNELASEIDFTIPHCLNTMFECVELIRYYLDHDKEREAIARAGQKRTLTEHTYYQRMQELADLVSKYL